MEKCINSCPSHHKIFCLKRSFFLQFFIIVLLVLTLSFPFCIAIYVNGYRVSSTFLLYPSVFMLVEDLIRKGKQIICWEMSCAFRKWCRNGIWMQKIICWRCMNVKYITISLWRTPRMKFKQRKTHEKRRQNWLNLRCVFCTKIETIFLCFFLFYFLQTLRISKWKQQ